MSKLALIVGAGSGNSAAFARALAQDGYQVALAARNVDKLEALCAQIGAQAFHCDATSVESVANLFATMEQALGKAEVVLYNPSAYTAGSITDLDPDLVLNSLMQTAYGAFLVAQQAAIAMQQLGKGAIFFTGATASVKGFPNFAPFAMGKFGLRGLAQSMARELAPQGIHVAHFVIDGGIRARDVDPGNDKMLDPDAIAESYYQTHIQHRSAWSWEVEVRPWLETF